MDPIVNAPVAPAAPAAPVPAAPVVPAVAPAASADPAAPVAPAAADPAAQAAPPEMRSVPLPVMQKLREELQAAKTKADEVARQNQMLNEQMALYRANPRPQTPAPAAPAPAAPASDFLGDVKDDQLLEAGQVRKAFASFQQQLTSSLLGALGPKLSEIEIAQTVPQYKQLLKTHIPAMMAENPELVQTINAMPKGQQLKAAVQLALFREKQLAAVQPAAPVAPTPTPQTGNIMDEINRIIENQAKPGNPGTGLATPAQAISLADKISSMTSEQFAAMKDSVKRGNPLF